jgi:hypothetical protein
MPFPSLIFNKIEEIASSPEAPPTSIGTIFYKVFLGHDTSMESISFGRSSQSRGSEKAGTNQEVRTRFRI